MAARSEFSKSNFRFLGRALGVVVLMATLWSEAASAQSRCSNLFLDSEALLVREADYRRLRDRSYVENAFVSVQVTGRHLVNVPDRAVFGFQDLEVFPWRGERFSVRTEPSGYGYNSEQNILIVNTFTNGYSAVLVTREGIVTPIKIAGAVADVSAEGGFAITTQGLFVRNEGNWEKAELKSLKGGALGAKFRPVRFLPDGRVVAIRGALVGSKSEIRVIDLKTDQILETVKARTEGMVPSSSLLGEYY